MTEHHETTSAATAREQELELEVARLTAELDTLRGDDPTVVTSRFLAMAAETVDRAVADARREADEIVEEISAEAEARRDEATRVAAEAEAMAEQLLADADRAQEAVELATEKAAAITADAEQEAESIVAAERQKIALEVAAVAEIRSALDEERAALDGYHESLRRRVEELANSMVSFMQSELPAGDLGMLTEAVADAEHSEFAAGEDPLDTPAPAAEEPVAAVTDPWLEMLETTIPEEDRIVDVPETAIDEVPVGPLSVFGGVPVIDDEVEETASAEKIEDEKRPSGGLFSRMRSREAEVVGFEDLAADDDDDDDDDTPVGLFGSLGPRLVEQTRPDTLAEALDTEDTDDQAFRQFLDGDDAPDPSRDWLLRPEQS